MSAEKEKGAIVGGRDTGKRELEVDQWRQVTRSGGNCSRWRGSESH